MKLFRYFTGWAILQLRAAEPEKLLTELTKKGIVFWDIKTGGSCELTACTSYTSAKQVMRWVSRMGGEAGIEKIYGIPAVLSRMRRHRFLCGGLVVCAALLLVSRAFVWQMEVRGNETVTEGEIRNALSECGMDIGTCWLGYSQDLLRNRVLQKLPELRWMTVSMEGCRAVVTVREKRVAPETVPEGEYAKIVAEKAGLVTELDDLRGTAETSVNKVVLPGETLIGGYATGRFGVQGPVRALGEVWARTWYEETVAIPSRLTVKTRYGREKRRIALEIGKKRINFYKDSSICPLGCDKIIERHIVSVKDVFCLPVTLEVVTVTPYETEVQTAQELREELEAAAEANILSRLSEGGELVSESFSAAKSEDAVYVTIRAECYESVGKTVPLTEAEIAEIYAKIPNKAGDTVS